METVRGRVSNLRRDVNVTEDSYAGNQFIRGRTADITNFELAGHSMQYKSSRPTYNSIAEADELIVAGKSKGPIFEVTEYRNLTKNITSYKGSGGTTFRLIAGVAFVVGIGIAAFLVFLSNSLMLVAVSIPFIVISALFFYIDYTHRAAIKAIENHK